MLPIEAAGGGGGAMGWGVKSLRYSAILLGVSNTAVVILGRCFLLLSFPSCGHHRTLPFVVVTLAAAIRIVAMVHTRIAQQATATTVVESSESAVVDAVVHH